MNNGCIIQWGVRRSGESVSITLPIAFTTAGYSIISTYDDDGGDSTNSNNAFIDSLTTIRVNMRRTCVRWVIIGK